MDNIISNAAEIRYHNKKRILKYLLAHDGVSKKEIALNTDLSPATVSNLSNQLMRDGFLSVSAFQKSSGGRNAGLLTIKHNHKYYLALRLLDETMVEAALISFEKDIVNSFFVSVKEQSREGIMQACEAAAGKCLEEAEKEGGGILGVGAALPGIVVKEQGILLNSTIPYLEGQPVISELQQRIHYPVTGANESNILALTLAEQHNKSTLLHGTIYLHLDEGLGIGIICNGGLLIGSHNRGGEISHIPIGNKGLLCKCGQKGCAETELSLQGFLSDYGERANVSVSWEEFCRDVKSGLPEAGRVVEEKGKVLGRLFAVLDSLFDPICFYLGGRGVELFEEMSRPIQNEFRIRQFIEKDKSLNLLPCYDYDRLLMKGCADLVFDSFVLQENQAGDGAQARTIARENE